MLATRQAPVSNPNSGLHELSASEVPVRFTTDANQGLTNEAVAQRQQQMFNSSPIGLPELAAVMGVAVLIYVCVFIEKWLRSRSVGRNDLADDL